MASGAPARASATSIVVGVLVAEMKIVQRMDQPCLFRDDVSDVVLELHHAMGPKEGLEDFCKGDHEAIGHDGQQVA